MWLNIEFDPKKNFDEFGIEIDRQKDGMYTFKITETSYLTISYRKFNNELLRKITDDQKQIQVLIEIFDH